jgi:hypothetical protein
MAVMSPVWMPWLRRNRQSQPRQVRNWGAGYGLLAGQKRGGVAFRQRKTSKRLISLAFSDFTHAELHGKTHFDP